MLANDGLYIEVFYYIYMQPIPMYSPLEHIIGEYSDPSQVEPLRHGITISEGQNVPQGDQFRLEYVHWELPGKLPITLDSLYIRDVATLQEARVASRTLLIELFNRSYRTAHVPLHFAIGNLKTLKQSAS